nr:hypothetical protein [Tanacetum cinerariifolium]
PRRTGKGSSSSSWVRCDRDGERQRLGAALDGDGDVAALGKVSGDPVEIPRAGDRAAADRGDDVAVAQPRGAERGAGALR